MMWEARSNQLNNSQYYEAVLFAKIRHQLRIKKKFKDVKAITFKSDNTIKIAGAYEDVCKHRLNVIDALNSSMCKEMMYSFSGKMMTAVMEHVKAVPTRFGVHCSVVRIFCHGEELYIASVSGADDKRNKACNSFEELFDHLKHQAHQALDEVILMEPAKKILKRNEDYGTNNQLAQVDWYKHFVEFPGHIFYIDSIYHAWLTSFKDEIEQLGHELGVNIYIAPSVWFPWIRVGEIAVEGTTDKIRQFRKRLDAIFGKAKKLSTILVFSKDVESELRKFQKKSDTN